MYKYLVFSLFISFSTSCQQKSSVQLLNPQEFYEVITKDISSQIVDVRTPEEFAKGHIPRAKNIEINKDFVEKYELLDKSRPVYVYCLAGGRSARAAEKLLAQGFTVYDLDKGMTAWRAESLPEVKNLASQSKGMTMDEYLGLVKSSKLVMVDFHAPWCGPCVKMKPFIEELKEELKDKVEIIKVDVDENAQLTASLKITALPVLKIYKDGKEVWSHMGYLDKEEIKSTILNQN